MATAAATTSNRPVQVKLVLLGESAVGKSSVVLRFCQNDFQENKEPTIGAAFLTQKCRLEDKVIKFEIWDTAGQERFRSLSPMYYRNAQAAVVVYDITKYASLDQAKTWVKELQRQANPNIVIALVGNKVDLVRNAPPSSPSDSPAAAASDEEDEEDDEDDNATATPAAVGAEEGEGKAKKDNASKRAVSIEEGEAYAKECGLLFFETSAKTGEGVVEVFTEIAKNIPFELLQNATANARVGAGGRANRGAAANAAAGGKIDITEGEGAAKEGCAC